MKIIVTDNNTQEIIIYTINEDGLEWDLNKDESEIIEEKLSEFHNLSEISWMILKNEFIIKFKNI